MDQLGVSGQTLRSGVGPFEASLFGGRERQAGEALEPGRIRRAHPRAKMRFDAKPTHAEAARQRSADARIGAGSLQGVDPNIGNRDLLRVLQRPAKVWLDRDEHTARGDHTRSLVERTVAVRPQEHMLGEHEIDGRVRQRDGFDVRQKMWLGNQGEGLGTAIEGDDGPRAAPTKLLGHVPAAGTELEHRTAMSDASPSKEASTQVCELRRCGLEQP
jgi:hypothetical protein